MGVKRGRNRGTVWQVDIEIDRVVLDGFDRIDRDAVAATLGRELARALRRGTAALSSDGADIELASRVARLPARRLSAGMPSYLLGRTIAEAVFGVLGDSGNAVQPPAPAVRPINVRPATRRDAARPGAPSDHAAASAGAPPHRAETAPR
jgi:hypothetical protein